MKKINPKIKFCLDIAKFQTELSRRLDSRLGGLGWNEFIILYRLSREDGQKMRRIDLAEAVGLTASGITRLLLPMEKIGLVKKEANARDARVSLVALAPGGRTKLSEGLERMEIFCDDLIPSGKTKKAEELSDLLTDLNKNI
ncbi:hypothetical protein A2303_05615 [Candidatus Falkowbacteria bacterium RIFOXYB2_FULL_47_14]|uniref:HTH marR-type domain-containing protein n=1 Tax=Candidatus Falkowbacteria bacterium RIFOXYA2_FULL_47_19 TaxID=1797994 RepID=A0A1F5SFL2_9BACT|nr:MAG: hypothetical protein A2227_07015 [Candidatus Falkowbacteria bacterium RIFOXYA2_FULL_47_19]OGF35322.1 MAG: hypothetical protein A2468_00165 [Candidatus Falkowbacteria bacterium RIFOXYC2_FULL_46_15]OGF43763.1 MAG: hypothetical protein A2303_05615 [Candidatus Falkowbacteria bacterium RIFOXYB2_FULL_47_14]